MIHRIHIPEAPVFDDETITELKDTNFFFGPNATGKTTISQLIEPRSSGDIELTFRGDSGLPIKVYNEDFVVRNIDESPKLDGVFTLGKENVDRREKIDKKKSELQDLREEIASIRKKLEGSTDNETQKGVQKQLEDALKRYDDRFWESKPERTNILEEAFEGYRNSKREFVEQAIDIYENSTPPEVTISDLKEEAKTLFEEDPEKRKPLRSISSSNLVQIEESELLEKRITGRDDVDIAELIEKLDASNWVKQGMDYFGESEPTCPFCQQDAPNNLRKKLEDYFDESYQEAVENLKNLHSSYKEERKRIESRLEEIKEKFPDDQEHSDKLIETVSTLVPHMRENERLLREKVDDPGKKITLETSSALIDQIVELIETENEMRREHNEKIDDLDQKQAEFRQKVWEFWAHERLEPVIESYNNEIDELKNRKDGLEETLEQKEEEESELDEKINDLKEGLGGIEESAQKINSLLSNYGLNSFKLKTVSKGDQYRLVRPDGTPVEGDLSEGERTFISFLYFYHSLFTDDVSQPQIVVIDDPVSSLDSEILFVVSELVRDIIKKAGSDENNEITQVMILTHNVYFHKEVSFRSEQLPGSFSFFQLRSKGDITVVEKRDSNPVKSRYELLWERIPNEEDGVQLGNTLRRILESYFKLLGEKDLEDLPEEFEGERKKICKSLLSWINDSSHGVHDSLHYHHTESMIDQYLETFRRIFEVTNHEAHFEMMWEAVNKGESFLKR